MQIDQLNKENLSLLQKIGQGCFLESEGTSIALYFSQATGPGFYLHAHIGDDPVLFFVNKSEWLTTAQQVLSFPSLEQLPKELHAVLVQHHFSLLENWLPPDSIPQVTVNTASISRSQNDDAFTHSPSHSSSDANLIHANKESEAITPTHLAATHCWILEIQYEAHKLAFALVDVPYSWLTKIATQLIAQQNTLSAANDFDIDNEEPTSIPYPALPPHIQDKSISVLVLPSIIGYTFLAQDELNQLAIGDAIVIEKHCALELGELWIQHEEMLFSARTLPNISSENTQSHHYKIEALSSLPTEGLAEETNALLPVIAKVGQIELPLTQLGAFSMHTSTQTIQLIPSFTTDIHIEIDKQLFARGQLLKIGDGWVIEITHRQN